MLTKNGNMHYPATVCYIYRCFIAKRRRTMKKKIIITALALGIGVAAAGCGSQASSTSTTAATEAATTAATTTTTAASTTTATEAATTAASTTETTTAAATELTVEEAKKIALKAAGLDEASVQFQKTEKDLDDAIKKYEIEFLNDGKEYTYEINLQTGEIIKQEVENAND